MATVEQGGMTPCSCRSRRGAAKGDLEHRIPNPRPRSNPIEYCCSANRRGQSVNGDLRQAGATVSSRCDSNRSSHALRGSLVSLSWPRIGGAADPFIESDRTHDSLCASSARHTGKHADLFPTVTDSSDREKIEYRVSAPETNLCRLRNRPLIVSELTSSDKGKRRFRTRKLAVGLLQ